ncbi:FmdB family transcriptional regulator [Acidovorax sp. NCPPB 2350]|nr:FmdB family transcriptional regulator [Acidovorax sp. NCPPB 2350]
MPISSISQAQVQRTQQAGGGGQNNPQALFQQVLLALLEGLLQRLGKDRQNNPSTDAGNRDKASGGGGGGGAPGSGGPSAPAPSSASTPSATPSTPSTSSTPSTPSTTPSTPSTPSATPSSPSTAQTPSTGDFSSKSVDEAQSKVSPKFLPVLRGDEQQKDAKVQTQADFGRAVDETAKEYGLDPNVFRAQLQSESGAFTQDFRKAMKAEGDLDRAGENNTSIGLGQISRKFLDGREWSDGGPGNSRVGSQKVSTEQYENSVTVQLRTAASNIAQRIEDHGGLKGGLAYYVSGNEDPNNSSAQTYLQHINEALRNPAVMNPGR